MSMPFDAAPITVTFFRDEFASKKDERRMSLSELAQLIRRANAPAKALLPWMKLAAFGNLPTEKNSLRWDGNVKSVFGVEGDYDGEKISFDTAVEIALKGNLQAILYTSPSHTYEKPRWRILCPFSRALSPPERSHMMARLNGLFGGIFSAESWALSQSFYYGAVNNNPNHQVEIVDGEFIDLLDELNRIAITKPAEKKATLGNGADPDPTTDAIALEDLDVWARSLITEGTSEGKKVQQRGKQFFGLVKYLRLKGYAVLQIVELFARYPDGVAGKYKGRLETEVNRIWGKFDTPLNDLAKSQTEEAPLPEQFSEDRLALEFTARHHSDWRYVALWGKWLQWVNTRWRPEETLRAFEMARHVCRAASVLADKESLARAVASASTVAGVERLARSDRRHAMTFDLYDADDWAFNQPQKKSE
jgi:hypothetical protein